LKALFKTHPNPTDKTVKVKAQTDHKISEDPMQSAWQLTDHRRVTRRSLNVEFRGNIGDEKSRQEDADAGFRDIFGRRLFEEVELRSEDSVEDCEEDDDGCLDGSKKYGNNSMDRHREMHVEEESVEDRDNGSVEKRRMFGYGC